MLVRHIVGERPVRFRRPSPEHEAKKASVREVLARHGPVSDDRVDDLFAAAVNPRERGGGL